MMLLDNRKKGELVKNGKKDKEGEKMWLKMYLAYIEFKVELRLGLGSGISETRFGSSRPRLKISGSQ